MPWVFWKLVHLLCSLCFQGPWPGAETPVDHGHFILSAHARAWQEGHPEQRVNRCTGPAGLRQGGLAVKGLSAQTLNHPVPVV